MDSINPAGNTPPPLTALPPLAFIGGGNMASALIGGLIQHGHPAAHIQVVEPLAQVREQLLQRFGVRASATAGATLAQAAVLVWAVKPQSFAQAAAAVREYSGTAALHLSVAAGIRSDTIAQWLGSQRVVRAMPNTPALIGQGISALYARAAVSAAERAQVEQLMAPSGQCLWVEQEQQLDAVTALSGSGPAYVFYFLEAMTQAGAQMGLSSEQAYHLARATFAGATALAERSSETPQQLRERVTSKGGTTYAALSVMNEARLNDSFIQALHAARQRASELGDEYGGNTGAAHASGSIPSSNKPAPKT